MDRKTSQSINGMIKNVQYADELPFQGEEAGALAKMTLTHFACGNEKMFALGCGALTKVNRQQALKKEIIAEVAGLLKAFGEEQKQLATPAQATGTNGT